MLDLLLLLLYGILTCICIAGFPTYFLPKTSYNRLRFTPYIWSFTRSKYLWWSYINHTLLTIITLTSNQDHPSPERNESSGVPWGFLSLYSPFLYQVRLAMWRNWTRGRLHNGFTHESIFKTSLRGDGKNDETRLDIHLHHSQCFGINRWELNNWWFH